MKQCSQCKQKYPATLDYFLPEKRARSGLTAACRQCELRRKRAYMRDRRKSDPDMTARYYAKNREQERKRLENSQRENPERAYERLVRYRENNRDKRRAGESRRRAQKRKTKGSLTAENIKAQYKRQNGRCYYCEERVGEDYHVDHLVPLSRGGLDIPENIVIACPTCNLSKADKLPHEWADGGRLL